MKIGIIQQKISKIVLLILALFQLALLFRRMKSDYSGALFWDEWDARLLMDLPLKDLNWSLFWDQHNEHRMVFSKILFFLDFTWFGGSNAALLVMNVILGMLILLVMTLALRLDATLAEKKLIIPKLYCFTIFSFSILQIENFSWAFQSAFFLSVLFPLISFYLYIKFVLVGSKYSMFLSYLFCILSIGTMASGIFSIIVILAISIFLRRGISEILRHLIISVILLGVYLHNYTTSHSSPLETLVKHPDFTLKYVTSYFVNPLNQVVGLNFKVFSISLVIFIFFVLLKNAYGISKRKEHSGPELIGLMIFAYSVLVATVSAGGRFDFGVNQSTASRYTTIALLGWFGALLVIIQNKDSKSEKRLFTWINLSVLVTILFIPFQISNSVSPNDVKVERDFASIVLMQNIQDNLTSLALYPDSTRLKILSQSLIREKKSIFDSEFQVRFSKERISLNELVATQSCLGYFDTVRMSSAKDGYIISGWVAFSEKGSDQFDLMALDRKNRFVGAGISGLLREDVARQLGYRGTNSGFGLVTKKIPYRVLAIQGSRVKCELKYQEFPN